MSCQFFHVLLVPVFRIALFADFERHVGLLLAGGGDYRPVSLLAACSTSSYFCVSLSMLYALFLSSSALGRDDCT